MSNTEAIAILVGALMPVIITIVKQAGLNRWWNLVITILACAVAGTLTVWARGELAWSNLAVVSATIFVASQAIYAAFWRSTPSESTLNDATSLVK